MSLKEATEIVGGPLQSNTKLPGLTYGLDPFLCKAGNATAELPGSICSGCYARTANYTRWPGVRPAWARRQAAIEHPGWEEAMIDLILAGTRRAPWFRWHDSGDLASSSHLGRIVRVAQECPEVQFWLPTREYAFVDEWIRWGGDIPPNLTIRLSSLIVGEPLELPRMLSSLRGLSTSTVHQDHGKPVQVGRRRDSIECRAYTRGGQCGTCRACWSGNVRNVSYPIHDDRPKRRRGLPVIQETPCA